MKHFKKTLALMLTVVMTVSLLVVPSFAAEAQDDPYASLKEGTGYVAIGDSYTRGYGASDHWEDQNFLNDDYGNFDCRNVDGSYPNRIAEAFGLYAPDDIRDTSAKMWPLAHNGVSVAYILDLLGIDDGYRDDEFTYQDENLLRRYATDLQYFGDPLSYTIDGQSTYGQTGEVMSARDMVKDASLFTVSVGQCYVFYKALINGLSKLDLSTTERARASIANIVSLLHRDFDYWKGAYTLLLDFIKENNPDAKVVLVGTMNPIQDVILSHDLAIRIGNTINIIMDLMNAYMKHCALKYGYMFVDISDIETPPVTKQISFEDISALEGTTEYSLVAHPTPKGHKQIADKIITAIERDLAKDSSGCLKKAEIHFAEIVDRFKEAFFRILHYLFGVVVD